VFSEYSNTSSHMLMGYARDRKLLTLGGSYARRLWHGREGSFSYLAEVRPMVFESDPVQTNNFTEVFSVDGSSFSDHFSGTTVGPCVAGTVVTTFPTISPTGQPNGTVTVTSHLTCGRRWNYAQSFSPVGFKQSFRPNKAVQPFVAGTVGYMYSSVPIPTEQSGSFNFAFDFGAGVEVFRSAKRSVSLEYRYHHFSNKGTASQNYGVDNGVFKVSYSFGR
jgi:opacity protein-like surface antigen